MRRLACTSTLVMALGCKADAMGEPASTGAADTEGADTEGETDPPDTFVGLRFEEIEAEGDWGMVTDARFIPGTDDLLVLEKSGRVGHLRLEGDRFALLGSFTLDDAYSVLDCGLISLALDPDFETNGFFYVGMCVSQQGSEIHRYTFDPDDYAAIPGTKALILAAGDTAAPKPWHNVGSLGFDPDGTM